MGKETRPFPTGHLRLCPKKNATTDTPFVIQLEYVVQGRAVRRTTGFTASQSDWDKSANKGRGGVKASFGGDYRNLNQRQFNQRIFSCKATFLSGTLFN